MFDLTKKIFFLSLIALLVLFLPQSLRSENKETITFKSSDGLEITADLYVSHDLEKPFIVLFHQAGWSRGEYKEIAPKLNKLGFNCIAIDQRSGGEVNDVINQTHKLASKEEKATRYIDAYEDLVAAVKYVDKNYAKGKLIIWGSSYSAALSIKVAGEHGDIVDGLLSFSPGEYFTKQGKSKTFITDAAKKVTCPTFITSARSEKPMWKNILYSMPSKNKFGFLPDSDGNHGSRALWNKFNDSKEYWEAVENFLKKYFMN